MDSASDAQQRIITASMSAHLLVLAPPGSGKTRTLAERIAYLLDQKIASPDQIVAMTFTERAAAELTLRLGNLAQPGVATGTFHRFCAYLLRREGSEIGLRHPIRIFDERQQRELLNEVAIEILHRRLTDAEARKLRNCISNRKCGNLTYDIAAKDSPFSVDLNASA